MTITLDSKVPEGPLADKWQNYIANPSTAVCSTTAASAAHR
jgi:hypothetical protein